ncbi:DivIVA domain-containing protein [Nocardioides sambongensis]|uniref:DivIVA domain-containing protein n=1 Tax=Nocardioides sambongensis TaxID=2589074 RepID=UPI001E651FF5|nr:DivIVA domain-containing protein [Nocardioides sambongensis]
MMMWVFAVLIVLAMGGIAMLAAGHGEPMRPTYDDRPDTLVPADRPLAAADLHAVRFPLAFRGYRMAEVDALLARLTAEMEAAAPDRSSAEGRAEPGAEPGRDAREPVAGAPDAAAEGDVGGAAHT